MPELFDCKKHSDRIEQVLNSLTTDKDRPPVQIDEGDCSVVFFHPGHDEFAKQITIIFENDPLFNAKLVDTPIGAQLILKYKYLKNYDL